jgi:hypothetical protein
MLCVIRFIRDEEHGLFGVIQKAQSRSSKKDQTFRLLLTESSVTLQKKARPINGRAAEAEEFSVSFY